MAFARTKFGIEYNLRPADDDESFPWAVVLSAVFVLTAISFTVVKIRSRMAAGEATPPAGERQAPAEASRAEEPSPPAAGPRIAPEPLPAGIEGRPAQVKNLLARLEAAESRRDVEMAIDTIERLRSLPGGAAADLDDRLARRLGALNLKKLYTLKSREWVKEVAVKRGDSLERISREHGATTASSRKLNGGDAGQLQIGQKVLVMKHPRFNLVVHGKPRYADLFFMGKFFKRYYLEAAPSIGKADFRLQGIPLKPADREELKTLLPASTTVLVSEF